MGQAVKKLFILIAFLLCAQSAWGLTEVPGNGVDDDASGGDATCAAPDADCDGYTTDGSSGLDGIDCDDTNRRIFPGVEVWTSGTSWKTCQTDGTYTAAGNSCPGGTCYYIDPTSGNDANAGTSAAAAFQTFKQVSYYASGAPANNKHSALACGDHIYLLPGTYNTGQFHTESGFSVVNLLIKDKTCTTNNRIKIHAIGAVVFDAGGTSGTDGVSITSDGSAIWIENSDFIEVKGNTAGEIKNFFSGGASTEKGAIKIRDSSNIELQGWSIHDNHGDGDNNVAGIYVSLTDDINIHHNDVFDEIRTIGNPAGVNLIRGFKGTNVRIYLNSLRYTPAATAYNSVSIKHGDYASVCRFDHNLVSKAPGFASACADDTFDHNIVADPDNSNPSTCTADDTSAFMMCDLGGPAFDGTQVVKYNTVINGRMSNWMPVNDYDTDGSGCTDCGTFGTLAVSHNVAVESASSGYYGAAAMEMVNPYGSNADYTSVIDGGKWTVANSCYYNSGAATLVYAAYAGSPAPNGFSYDYSGFTGAGYCSGCQYANPTLNSRLEATAGTCSGTAGWNVGWLSNLGTGCTSCSPSTPATSNPAHLINHVLWRHNRR